MITNRQNRPITAEIIGGLGNQLFIYAAALEQSFRLGVELEIDRSWFDSQEKRRFQLDQIFPIRNANHGVLENLANRASKALRLPGLQPQVFSEVSEQFDPAVFNISPGTRLRGYFQSLRYFPNVGAEIAQRIYNLPLSEDENKIFTKLVENEFNAIHVRRGDYAQDKTTMEYHGLTSRTYFEESLRLFPNPKLPVLVFTDSIDATKNELDGLPNLWFADELERLSDITTLKLMSHASSLAMSNSSFSWWAAYTISSIKAESRIISPRPWSRDIFFNRELIKPSWISLGT